MFNKNITSGTVPWDCFLTQRGDLALRSPWGEGWAWALVCTLMIYCLSPRQVLSSLPSAWGGACHLAYCHWHPHPLGGKLSDIQGLGEAAYDPEGFVLHANSAGSCSRFSEPLWWGVGVLCNWHVSSRFFGSLASQVLKPAPGKLGWNNH